MAKSKIKGTRTEKNVTVAYLNESQSYARYMFFAKAADKELYFPVGHILRETAENELSHAKVFLKMLDGDTVDVTLPVDSVAPGTTADNLEIAIQEEAIGGVRDYNNYAKIADEEGFADIASHFRAIAEAEQHHLDKFTRLLNQVKEGTVWKRKTSIQWQCLVCGYIHEGTTPPKDLCPGCDHPFQHYMPLDF